MMSKQSKLSGIDADELLNRVEQSIGDAVKIKIADLIIAWARYDMNVGLWTTTLLSEFGIPFDLASIFTGNLDTETRLLRLKQAAKHYGNIEGAKNLANLIKSHKHHVEVRNMVAHWFLMGQLDQDKVVFLSTKHRLGELGTVDACTIKLSELDAARKFAEKANGYVIAHVKRLKKTRGLPFQ